MNDFKAPRTTLLLALLLLVVAPVSVFASKSGPGGIGTGSGGSGTTTGESAGKEGTFPILGAHRYGDGLGAGRGHQGQDLIAKCGKPVVAAQGGRVRIRDYQGSGAGNYVVIKSRETKLDYVYMHLLSAARVSVGDRVETGEALGRVGTTGSSTTCHLHFEMWSAPGWYRGGAVIDPRPHLRRWDSGRK